MTFLKPTDLEEQFIKRLENVKFIQEIQDISDSTINHLFNVFTNYQQDKLKIQQGMITKQSVYYKDINKNLFIDGLIIADNGNIKDQQIFKWKNANDMTIDLYAYKLNKEDLQQSYKQEYLDKIPIGLFVPMNKQDYQHQRLTKFLIIDQPPNEFNIILVPFQTTIDSNCNIYWRDIKDEEQESIHGKVCEMIYNNTNNELNKWELQRIRYDKNPKNGQYGNYYLTAEKVLFDILNPIPLDYLWQSPKNSKIKSYFLVQSGDLYKQVNTLHGYIKNAVINYANSLTGINNNINKTILDLGIGQGNNILKYSYINALKVIGIDNDLNALAVLSQKKNELNPKINSIPNLQVFLADLNSSDDVNYILKETKGINYDIVLALFSIHYYIYSNSFDKLINSLNKNLSFVITFLDGSKVLNLLEQNNGIYQQDITINGKSQMLFSIKYHNKSNNNQQDNSISQENDLQDKKQYIDFYLPFAKDYVTETLVTPQYLINKFKSKGFTPVIDFNFDMKGNYKLLDSQDTAIIFNQLQQLNKIELMYSELYRVMVFKN